jgi:hypothetical protein
VTGNNIVRVMPESCDLRVISICVGSILVDDFNCDVSNCGENKGQRGECKENLKKDFRDNQHFVIGINHVQTLQHGDKKTIKIENKIHAKRKHFSSTM